MSDSIGSDINMILKDQTLTWNIKLKFVSLKIECFTGFAQAWKVLEFSRAFLNSTWKLNLPWKVLENHSKTLKSPWILLFSVELNTVYGDLNQYKIVVLLFGAENAAPNKGITISTHFLVLISPLSQSSILKKNFNTSISIFSKLLVLENCKIVLRSPWKVLEFYSNFPVWTLDKISWFHLAALWILSSPWSSR